MNSRRVISLQPNTMWDSEKNEGLNFIDEKQKKPHPLVDTFFESRKHRKERSNKYNP
jgi:hypothetical protein